MSDVFSLKLERVVKLDGYKPAIYPKSFLVTPDNCLVICDEMNHRLVKTTLDGKLLHSIGKRGSALGEFHYPKGIATDQEGSIYVADSFNHRLVKLTATGRPVREFKGENSWHFNSPSDVLLLDDESLIVVDNGNHRIVKINPDGCLLAQFGYRSSEGEEKAFRLSQLTRPKLKTRAYLQEPHWEFPQMMARNEQGNFIVADPHNQRLVMTTASGRLLSYLPLPENCWPQSLAVDPNGYLWIADNGQSHGLMLLTAEGILVKRWGNDDGPEWQLRFPQKVWASNDHLFLADSFNQRLLIFQRWTEPPKRAYSALISHSSEDPLVWQKYAHYLEKTAQKKEARAAYQKLISENPAYLLGHYHYLNFLRTAKDNKELARELPAFSEKVLAESRRLTAELELRYQAVCQVSQELASTTAEYEIETLNKGAAADSLVDRQEKLLHDFRAVKTQLRQVALELGDNWQLLVKIVQRLERDATIDFSSLIEPLCHCLDEVMAIWAESSRRQFKEELIVWETKFTQNESKVTWADVYYANQQIGPQRALSAAYEEVCLAILTILISFQRSSTSDDTSWPQLKSLFANFGQLYCFYPEDLNKLESLLNRFTLFVELGNWQLGLAQDLPQNLAVLVKMLDYPSSEEQSEILSWFLLGRLHVAAKLPKDPDRHYELEKEKNQLVLLIIKWQERLLSNLSHQQEGRKKTAILENSLKTIKKEDKSDRINVNQQFAIARWASHLSLVFYQQALKVTVHLFGLYLELEKASGDLFLELSEEKRQRLLIKLSDLPEPDWESATADQLKLLFENREAILTELVKWEHVAEEEVERWGYLRPGTKIYQGATNIDWQQSEATIKEFNQMLEKRQSLKHHCLKCLINETSSASESIVNLEKEAQQITRRLIGFWLQKKSDLSELEKMFAAQKTADRKQALLFKKLDRLMTSDQSQIQSLLEKWQDLTDVIFSSYAADSNRDTFDVSSEDHRNFWCLHPDFTVTFPNFLQQLTELSSKKAGKLTSSLILDILANHKKEEKEFWAGLLNRLKAATIGKTYALFETVQELGDALVKQEKRDFALHLEQEKLAAEMLGLLELSVNPLMEQKRLLANKSRKKRLYWRWFLTKNKYIEAGRFNLLLWDKLFNAVKVLLSTSGKLPKQIQEEIDGWCQELAQIWTVVNQDFIANRARLAQHSVNTQLGMDTRISLEKHTFMNQKSERNSLGIPQTVFYHYWLRYRLDKLREETFLLFYESSKDPQYLEKIYRQNPAHPYLVNNRSLIPSKNSLLFEHVSSFGFPNVEVGFGLFISGVASHEGEVYVTDFRKHKVHRFSKEGAYIGSFGEMGREKGQLWRPFGSAWSKEEKLYISEYFNHRIQVFSADGLPLKIIGGPGKEPGKFNQPMGIKLDRFGNLFVVDKNNRRLQVFNPKGEFISATVFKNATSLSDVVLQENKVFVLDLGAGEVLCGQIEYNETIPQIKQLPALGKLGAHANCGVILDNKLLLSSPNYDTICAYSLDDVSGVFSISGLDNYKFNMGWGMFLSKENGNDYLYFIEEGYFMIHKLRIIWLSAS